MLKRKHPRSKPSSGREGDTGDAFSSRPEGLRRLERLDGERDFVAYLEVTVAVPTDYRHWPARSVSEVARLAGELRRALEGRDRGIPFFYATSIAVLVFPVPVAAALMKETRRIWKTHQVNFPTKRMFCQLLEQLEAEAKVFDGPIGRREMLTPAKPIGRAWVYRWLGAMVPYTAFVQGSSEPAWPWIESWIATFDPEAPPAKKMWFDSVESRARAKKKLNPNLARILRHAAIQFIRYSREKNFPDAKAALDSPWSEQERRYLGTLDEMVPFLFPGQRLGAIESYRELLLNQV